MAELPSKLFFRIGEVAGLVGVEPHVLRYWEREFRSIRPTKSAKGQRVYSRKDVENLLRVRDLLYRDGFTIAGAKKKLSVRPEEKTDTMLASVSRDALADTAAAPPGAAPFEAAPFENAGDSDAAEESAPARVSDAALLGLLANPTDVGELRTTLLSLRAEVAGFLAELGGAHARSD